MVFLEECVAKAVSDYGMTLVPLQTFRFNTDRQNMLFRDTAEEFAQMKPRQVVQQIQIGQDGIVMPEGTIRVTAAAYDSFTGNPQVRAIYTPPIRFREFSYNDETRQLLVPASGTWRVTYLTGYGIDKLRVTENVTVFGGQTRFSFPLKADYQPNSLVLSMNGLTVSDDGFRNLNGPLGFGEVIENITSENSRYTINLEFDTPPTTDSVLQINLQTLNFAAEYITEQDRDFFDLFGANLMLGFANAKQMLQIEGIPVDLDLSNVLEQARTAKEQVREKLIQRSHWEMWLPGH